MNSNPDVGGNTAIPVTVLTGFLGSGKTTLLSRLLRDPGFAHTAVIINEFGEVGLDHELLEQSQEEMVLLSNGCVCCTVRGDLITTLADIHARHEQMGINRVVLETTGLADPAPILHTLMADPSVTAKFRLEHLVATVDAFNGVQTLKINPVAVKQVAIADRIVLTKTDLVEPAASDALRAMLHSINKYAPVHVARQGEIDPALLFASLAENTGLAWLQETKWEDDAHHHDHGDHDHEHGEHESQHGHYHADHDSAIRSYCIVREEPIAWSRFAMWLDMISAMRGDDLLRVKGIVNVLDHPDRPVVIHGVQHIFHPPRILDKWPGKDRRTRLVFITRNIEQEDIDLTLQIFEQKK